MSIDLGIITIRPDEYTAVLRQMDGDSTPHATPSGFAYRLGKIGRYTVAVTRLIEQGNTEAAVAASQMLRELDPATLAVCGIGGGTPTTDFSLGDVVVGTRLHDMSVEARAPDGSSTYASAGGPVHRRLRALLSDLPAVLQDDCNWHSRNPKLAVRPPVDLKDSNFYGEDDWRADTRRALAFCFVEQERAHPIVVLGSVAASDRLVKNADLLGEWRKYARQTHAVEMESAGIYKSAQLADRPLLIVRGISDIVGFRRDTGWTSYACESAATALATILRAGLLPGGGIRPQPREAEPVGESDQSTQSSPHANRTSGIQFLAEPTLEVWTRLLIDLSLFGSAANPTPVHTYHDWLAFQLKGPPSTLIACNHAPGRVLSVEDLQRGNLELDTGGHDEFVFVTLGEMESQAEEVYARLSNKKPIRALRGKQIAERLLAMGEASASLLHDTQQVRTSCLITATEYLWLTEEATRAEWFKLTTQDGRQLPPDAPSVRAVRLDRPSLKLATYGGPQGTTNLDLFHDTPFDAPAYLLACEREFSRIRYDALSAVGFRFQDVTLLDLYVPATGEATEGDTSTLSIQQTIQDYLSSLKLNDGMKARLESQLKAQLGLGARATAGSADDFFRRHKTIIVTGDPGSGKTFFVKRQILHHCKSYAVCTDWHSRHLPVYVSLADLSKHIANDGDHHLDYDGILAAIVAINERDGLPLTLNAVRTSASSGSLALFLDGFDEVVSFDHRVVFLEFARDFVERAEKLGNRLVLTSRPSAIFAESVPGAQSVHLRGFDPKQVRTLAQNILSLRVGDSDGQPAIVEQKSTTDDTRLLDRLLDDLKENQGIARLAQNPLMLTLLIMVYLNGGAFAVRRHRVYADAVRTLVSIRNRGKAKDWMSESDLRESLGHFALRVLAQPEGVLPPLGLAVHLVSDASSLSAGEAEDFLREVADKTGVLVIRRRPSPAEPVVSFMHFSFAEYFAANALARQGQHEVAARLAFSRWRDIATLAAAILAERQSITPLVDEILSSSDAHGVVTGQTVLMALGCALEASDVPRDARRSLIDASFFSLQAGPASRDRAYRRTLSGRLGELYSITGSTLVEDGLIAGLESASEYTRAVYVESLGFLSRSVDLPPRVLESFERALGPKAAPPVCLAAVVAMVESRSLRTDIALSCAAGALRHRRPHISYLALSTLEDSPALCAHYLELLPELFEHKNRSLAGVAGRAYLLGIAERQGELCLLDSSAMLTSLGERVLRALTCWENIAVVGQAASVRLPVAMSQLEALLGSTTSAANELGVRLLPWSDARDSWVFARLRSTLFSSSPSLRPQKVAALNVLSIMGMRGMSFTEADLDRLVTELGSHRDIRAPLIKVLAQLDHTRTTEALIQSARVSSVDERDYRLLIRALANSGARYSWVFEFLYEELLREYERKPVRAPQLSELLRAVQSFPQDTPRHGASLLRDIAEDYSLSMSLRVSAMRAYALLCPADARSVEYLIKQLASRQSDLARGACAAAEAFVFRVRSRLADVRNVAPELPKLHAALLGVAETILRVAPTRGDDTFRSLRSAMEGVQEVLAAFEEYSTRATAVP